MGEPMKPLRNCDQCGDPFRTRRSDARFCSDVCKSRWHNREAKSRGSSRKRLNGAERGEGGPAQRSGRRLDTRYWVFPAEVLEAAAGEARTHDPETAVREVLGDEPGIAIPERSIKIRT